jgi:hypothetical protein
MTSKCKSPTVTNSATAPSAASFIDIHRFKQTLRKGLRGLSYIGMIEPALYVNIAPGTRWSAKRAVSWHVHAICRGKDREQMRKRFARLIPLPYRVESTSFMVTGCQAFGSRCDSL